MATFFYSFLSLQHNVEMSPSKVTSSLPLYPSFFLYIFFTLLYTSGCRCSWVMSIIVVHIRRRNMYIVHCARTPKKKEKTTNNGALLLLILFLLLSFSIYIYRCCDTHIHISSNACTSHTFLSSSFFFSPSLLHACYLCLMVSIVDG